MTYFYVLQPCVVVESFALRKVEWYFHIFLRNCEKCFHIHSIVFFCFHPVAKTEHGFSTEPLIGTFLFPFLHEEPGKYLILQILSQKLTVHFGISHLQWNATVLFPAECLEVCVCSSIMEAQQPFSYQCNSPLIHHGCSLLSMHERVCVCPCTFE